MNLIRLEHHHHPRPPHHELRQKSVLDTGSRNIGDVANLYVDDDMDLQFMDVVTGGGSWAWERSIILFQSKP